MHGHASGESNIQVSDDGDEHEEYGVNRLNYDTTEKDIEELRKEYHILGDITLRLLGADEVASKLSDGETMIYMEMFRLGFRLPIQPYFARMLVRLGLSHGQLDPNRWRILGCIYIVWVEQNKVELWFKEFTHLHLCNEHGRNVGISERLRIRVERGLLHTEDWKLLLTSKRLFSTDIISNFPQNKEKTRTKGNITYASRTPAKIAKALVEETLDE
ncbi:hypothetical protein WN943_006572 [Citrus x changshan-huyou]